MIGPHRPGHRPPWWPDAEPWPPVNAHYGAWRATRRRYLGFAFGCFALVLLGIGVGVPVLAWLAGAAVGTGPTPFPTPVRPFIFVAMGLGIAAFFLLIRSLGRFVTPFADLVAAANRVSQGDFSARVREHGPRDVRALARAFNTMSARLEEASAERRGVLAQMTHELRTPLTVIQGNLEAIIDGVYPADEAHLATLLAETHRLSRRIDDLRTLALTDSGALVLQKSPTDLGMLVTESVAAFESQADSAGVALRPQIGSPQLIAEVDGARLHEVLENLLANALRYTHPGGAITVRTTATPSQATIIVEDTGTGIAPDRLPHIFDRFTKGPDSPGMGLGLAIARDLVRAHGGDLTATSTLGQGTRMEVRLPAS